MIFLDVAESDSHAENSIPGEWFGGRRRRCLRSDGPPHETSASGRRRHAATRGRLHDGARFRSGQHRFAVSGRDLAERSPESISRGIIDRRGRRLH